LYPEFDLYPEKMKDAGSFFRLKAEMRTAESLLLPQLKSKKP